MDTLRLKKLSQPAHVERLLDAFVTRSQKLPEGAYQVRDPDVLGAPLQRVLQRLPATRQVWVSWAHGTQTWLFTAEVCHAPTRERGSPVLRVNRYSQDGVLEESGIWLIGPQGNWEPLSGGSDSGS